LASRDVGSDSDTYAIIKCGDNVFDERENYQDDEPNPKFYKMYEFSGKFPGCMPLEIECWDYDCLFGDDIIGSTVIDLDDRFFNPKWQALEQKPIEYRELYYPAANLSQGTIKCWVDIEQAEKKEK